MQLFERIHSSFEHKVLNTKSKPTKYTLFDYLHDFRVWANYLDIDNLLSLRGSGYKAFIDQNLSTILFFMAGISEISYLSVLGQEAYLKQLQELYKLIIANNPQIEQDFVNTSLYQRCTIYKNLGFVTSDFTLHTKSEPNKVIIEK